MAFPTHDSFSMNESVEEEEEKRKKRFMHNFNSRKQPRGGGQITIKFNMVNAIERGGGEETEV